VLDDKGVNAVIGVILMVAITFAIAATVYVYVARPFQLNIVEEKTLSGQIIEKFRGFDYNNIYYFFTLENNTLDLIKDIEVKETVFHLYDVGNYYDAYNIRR